MYMNNDAIIDLINKPLPRGSRKELTYCQANKADMERWLSELTLLNMSDLSKQIRTTLTEIGELVIEEPKRLELMEVMRKAVNNLNISLSKFYINQAVIVDARGINVAHFVQHLRASCFAVYNTIALRLREQSGSGKKGITSLFSKLDNKKEALAIHRALSELSALLYETKLLYLTDLQGVWRHLNRMYVTARDNKLLKLSFDDPNVNFGSKLTVKEVYMRSVLLSIARTNRLRQSEIKKLYEYSELWSTQIQADVSPHANDLFLIDLGSDTPPTYITTSKNLSGDIVYVNALKLLDHLKALKASQGDNLLHPSERSLFHTNLVDFVANSIEEPLERSFSRHPFQGKLDVCVGLLGTHYHVAGKRQFSEVVQLKQLMQSANEMEILVDKSRHFHDGDLLFDEIDQGNKIDRSMFGVNQVDIINMSPGGYRVAWKGVSAPTLRTGEIMCLREQDQSHWQVGIIRWVQQNPGVGADFGIEVISSNPTACGVKPARVEDTSTQFMRAILLPEVKSLNRAATLITPSFHFKENHRVKIRVGQEEVLAQMGNEHLCTQSFNQYDFALLADSVNMTRH